MACGSQLPQFEKGLWLAERWRRTVLPARRGGMTDPMFTSETSLLGIVQPYRRLPACILPFNVV
jgi:hypothetical protein